MIRFESDYTEGATPEILRALDENNFRQMPGYGVDDICERARGRIRAACEAPEADVHFLVGGTQTNLIVLAAALRPHQGAVCADAGHIAVHESGSIEATGHKVLGQPSPDGKLSAQTLDAVCAAHWNDSNHEHMVQPALAYLSQPTETGGLYTLAELEALRAVCDRWGVLLYVDGARLGYALAAAENDVTLPDLARLCDAFYIGGTKVGALFGEALVLTNPALQRDFRYILKQRGGMLAKGWLLGLQFDVLFRDGTYLRIARHAVEQAMRIRAAFEAHGCKFLMESATNQQFPILPDDKLAKLSESFASSLWCKMDAETSAVRFCTSWATRPEDVDALIAAIDAVFAS
jgi:threonine aldolase